MTPPIFSLVVNHTPWRPERVAALRAMRASGLLDVRRFLINDRDWRGTDWQDSKVQWALDQWEYSLGWKDATHHVFVTDDLNLAPGFWGLLEEMVLARPEAILGLLSNHPRAPELAAAGVHWYRTNSWIVGPAYVVPRLHLMKFVPWFRSLPDGRAPGAKGYANDDSTLNEWVSRFGPGEAWHPVPTIIEHRGDLESTVGHGDEYSRERVSWRSVQTAAVKGDRITWTTEAVDRLEEMNRPDFWAVRDVDRDAPMLRVGG